MTQPGKEPTYQYRKCKKYGLDPWVGKIPWRRKSQTIQVFLPGEFHGQRSLEGCSPHQVRRVRLSCSPMHVLTDIWWFIRHRFSTDFHVIQTSCLHLYTCDLRQIFSELFHVRVTMTEWSEVVAERIGSQESEHLDLDSKLSVLCLGAITSCLWALIPSSVKWK